MKRVLVVGLALCLSACTVGKQKSEGILAADGYSDIKVGGNAFFGCAHGDSATQTFEGTKNGYRVKGALCGHVNPFGKAPTIRIFSTKRL